jgi:hypothetical protein
MGYSSLDVNELKKEPSFTMTYREKAKIAELLVKIDQILNFKKIDNAQTLKLIRLNRRVMGYIRQH